MPLDPARPKKLGASPISSDTWEFVVWAPDHDAVRVRLANREESIPLERLHLGYHRAVIEHVPPGSLYRYELTSGKELPDPASRYQPEGVHGPSQTVSLHDFSWSDSDWKGVPLEDTVFYELHVGTFTPEGTLRAIIPHLKDLANLGVTTVELMPLAQFSGARNWGYDGVFPYALQNTYGTPRDLQALVDAAHQHNLAVALDVVYNHLGPEGNYCPEYGPYFTQHYKTPWGPAINFDGPQSDEVRHFFVSNALYWLENFHIDALRLDAVHGVYDASAYPFLADLSDAVAALSRRLGRKLYLIAESDLNDVRVVRPTSAGGFGADSQWSDDFHHCLHTLLTHETAGYYKDFGHIHHLGETLRHGWYFSGQFSKFRQRKHGNSPKGLESSRFVVCAQNHDQIGNRPLGDRLSESLPLQKLKLAAGITLLSPFIPLLFMGEEYGETAPFQYFASHSDPELAQAVRRGRNEEARSFGWQGDLPDPQSESTFLASKLHLDLVAREPHRTLRLFYGELLRFRAEHRLSQARLMTAIEYESQHALLVVSETPTDTIAAAFNFSDAPQNIPASIPHGAWHCAINSAPVTQPLMLTLSSEGASRRGEGPVQRQDSAESQIGTATSLSSDSDQFEVTGELEILLQPHSFIVLKRRGTSQ
jgi:maltooligosyltrehalose trehalohydrolase